MDYPFGLFGYFCNPLLSLGFDFIWYDGVITTLFLHPVVTDIGGEISGNHGPLQGPPTEGAGMGILSRAHQEHLGGLGAECTPGQGILPRGGGTGGHGEPIPWGLRRGAGDGGPVVAGEGGGVGGICQEPCRGGPQAPVVRLRGSAEVTPTGLGIRVEGHPRDQQRVWASGGGDRKYVPPGTV